MSQIPNTPANVLDYLQSLGINSPKINYQLSPEDLTNITVEKKLGTLSDTGALVILTGEFTGRSPKDKFTVKDSITADTVDWNEFNIPIDEATYKNLRQKVVAHISQNEIYVRDAFACADKNYRIGIRVINELPANNMFCYNMFIRPTEDELQNFTPDWTIVQSPSFKADSIIDGTRQHNFAIISFTDKFILIGGTGYTGEMKKGIFSVLNFILPYYKNVFSMHCSANMGDDGGTAIFFGLSGTGKTTLSADPARHLIGDDEHGWTDTGVFNFEGGCYAKTIGLTKEKEPEIYDAIKPGALLENITFYPGTNKVDYNSKIITENTRVSYPIDYISNAIEPSIGNIPKNIFFLTCDAYGILPPISKLTPGQTMYYFISGYTAKVAGTEEGVTEPKATFSACFGAPFLPLAPVYYAKMLGERMQQHQVNVWMINTGWTGGPYGVGHRINLDYTRAMITAVFNNELDNVSYQNLPVFNLSMPTSCPNVPSEILNPRNTWADENAYDDGSKKLANLFNTNFEKYKNGAPQEVLDAAPKA